MHRDRKPAMMFRRILLNPKITVALLVFSAAVGTTFGTTFVALSTDREVVLGIDTKQGHQKHAQILSDSKVCKVITRKTSAYAFAGVTGITKGQDLYPLVNSLATDDVTTTFQAINVPIASFLTQLVPKMSPEDLASLVGSSKPITEIIGIQFKQKGVLRDLSFYVGGNGRIRSEATPYANPASTYTEVQNEISSSLPPDWQGKADLSGLVRTLMSTGIKADPDESGYARVRCMGVER